MPTKTTKEKVTKKKTATKKAAKTAKTTKKATAKKASTTKKVSAKKTTTTKKTVAKKTTKKTATKKVSVPIIEYYDLPYRYNQTVVKVLAQTPNRLFIYWDISDEDKQNLINQYGEYFFNNTKPVLVIRNKTMGYNFEVDINDYANCWYLEVNDPKCDYQIELGRRLVKSIDTLPMNSYIHITESNDIEAPNDHILFEELGNLVLFENVKTKVTYEKDISSISFLKKLGNLLNVKDLYIHFYKDQNLGIDRFDLKNPGSFATSNMPTSGEF